MLNDTYILILDDNEENQKSSEVILNFIGEHSISYGLSQWLSAEQSRDMDKTIGMIILSLVNTDKNLEKVLKKIHETYGFTPILLLSNCDLLLSNCDSVEITEDFDPHVKHMIVARMCNELNYSDLNDAIHRAQRYNESREQMNQQSNRRPAHLFRSLVGTSRLIKSVRTMMSQVADKDVTVLIAGESGTGKEVVARNLHYHSARREYPFVPVNCGAIPSELLESELFGHEKGAFTGAVNARAGRFELAEGGTLFLDEIGDMPLHMQVKILRVLQEKSYERVGGNKFFKTNVRIIAATHRNLEEMIEQGKFREDLYYRLNVFPIEMPSLRERSEDIPLLINELVAKLEHEKRGSIRFNSVAILSLCRHPWHGNVRELANLVERMAIMHPFGVVGVQDLPAKYRHVEVMEEDIVPAPVEESSCEPTVVSVSDVALLPENGIDLKEYISGLELSLIQQALDNTGGVVARAAEQLMIRRTTLVEKMKKYGLQRG